MKKMAYYGIEKSIMPRIMIRTAPGFFSFFAIGLFLDLKEGIEWAIPILGILGVLVFGGFAIYLLKKYLAELPCLICMKVNMIQKKSSLDHYVLICPNCEIEWDTCISTNDPA